MRAALALLLVVPLVSACAPPPGGGTVLTVSGSSVGAEAELLRTQLRRFEAAHPGLTVRERFAPDAADQRHQLYVQWLNAHSPDPDLLQLDVIWTPEFAAAGWLLPLDGFGPDRSAFFPATMTADTWDGRLFALPWFVDVGVLYYRTDLVPSPPATFEALSRDGLAKKTRYGFVWQGARYEGLTTVFLEHLGGFGGRILDDQGNVTVDSEEAVRALTFMVESLASGLVPEAALTWQEEPTRFAFESGDAVFLRNWPYASPLLSTDKDSKVRGRFAVTTMPASAGGRPTAALGGAQLGLNAFSRHPREAYELLAFLTAPAQMLERARVVGQYPARPALYDDPALATALSIPPSDARRIIEHAVPRPVTPVYAQLSGILQIRLHQALTRQLPPKEALSRAAEEMRAAIAAAGLAGRRKTPAAPASPPLDRTSILFALAAVVVAALLYGSGRAPTLEQREARLGRRLVAPTLAAILLIAVLPLLWTVWESLHDDDLRLPWRGRPFVGLAHYAAILHSGRAQLAHLHTLFFTAATVVLEIGIGLALALSLNRAFRGRGAVRAAVLVPWAIPTVVAAILWRFLFDTRGVANTLLVGSGLAEAPVTFFAHPLLSWVPVVLADAWKTTPFVALLLLAGLQSIDSSLYEAARVDGASTWQRFRFITLPMLKPALLVAVLFRALDAFRVFDLVYVLTGGGPGTATEPLSLLSYEALLSDLRFGYGAALATLVFAVTFVLSLVYLRLLGASLTSEGE